MDYTKINFGLGFSNNIDSNDYLRCLWACIRKEFGKLAWNTFPFKDSKSNNIQIGYADIGVGHAVYVKISYNKRGCLKTIYFDNIENSETYNKLEGCIKKAQKFSHLLENHQYKTFLSDNINFEAIKGKNFRIIGNELVMNIKCFDEEDAKNLCVIYTRTICSILSFLFRREA